MDVQEGPWQVTIEIGATYSVRQHTATSVNVSEKLLFSENTSRCDDGYAIPSTESADITDQQIAVATLISKSPEMMKFICNYVYAYLRGDIVGVCSSELMNNAVDLIAEFEPDEKPPEVTAFARMDIDGSWIVVVNDCPYCGRSHIHSGGKGLDPVLGYRDAGCIASVESELRWISSTGYTLVHHAT